ncbi:MAG: YihY family inner membrane protein [Betaproteobacteria bacterium]|nr:YihY family inner membrane protein [Betaproteobacteria bacterium]
MRPRLTRSDVLRMLRPLRQRFEHCRLAQTAGSLTFTTLISLVPLLAVGLSLFTAFPAFHHLEEHLQQRFASAVLPPRIGTTVLGYLNAFAERAAGLGAAGVAGLALSAISLMFTVDRALNTIWYTPRPRPLGQRVLLYWAAVTLGPLILGATLAASAAVLASRNGWMHHVPGGAGALLTLLSWALLALALAALYRFAPNADVRWRDALGGGTIAAVGFGVAGRVFTWYVGTAANYTAVYGTFAALPVFLLWIYFSWMVVLLGAMLAAHLPLLRLRVQAQHSVAGSDFLLALRVLRLLHDSRDSASPGRDILSLAGSLHCDPLRLPGLLDLLEALGWVGRVAPSPRHRELRWAMLVDAQQVDAAPLLDALVLDHRAAAAASPQLASEMEALWHGARLEKLLQWQR